MTGACPDCGRPLPREAALLGLCPQCLLSMALEDEEVPTLHGQGPGGILGERYQIREVLGRGGMGEVYRAFDLKLRVDVALKAVRPELLENERAQELLRREVRSAREVVSPNVCRIFDLVVEEERELVSMEYIDGTTLGERLRERGPLELQEAREIASQFLSGLEAIHEAGLVHRDFKPENVMLTRAGRVVVMDFGLAKARSEGQEGKLRTIAGTPAYMSPEQSRGEEVDARADVFSAGVVLVEMVTAGPRDAVWHAVRKVPPEVPDNPWAPVLRQALSSDRESRQPTARALARALDEITHRLPGSEDKHPYPGLASFTPAEAEYFFGREMEVEAVWKKLKRPRLLALIGPSGAGKSSFLRAGLLPTVPPGWSVLLSTPGHHPMESLAEALLPVFAGDMPAIQSFLRFRELETALSLFTAWRKKSEHGLVMVDQFEELFTLNPPEVQESFATLLGQLVLEADVHVLLSMRDDFLFHCQKHESLAPVFSELTPLGTLSPSALRRALVQPALACGYRFEEEALVEEMVSEVSQERGVLPLLAFAASRLWEKRDREKGLLTREAYREIGGVGGALAQHAEETLERIGAERTPIVRELFRNLVTAQGTRASREVEELLSIFTKEEERRAAEEVLRELVSARLLTSYETSVEIIHESLLTAWPRLVRWQAQDADGAVLRDQLRQAAQAWQDRGRPDDLLWTGNSYRELSLWRERYTGGLSTTEEAFAGAATKLAGRRRRRRRIAAATAFAVLLAVVAVVIASRQQAVQAALRSEASKLLALAELKLQEDPTEALAFATASLDVADSQEGRVFAMKALWEAPPAFELSTDSQGVKVPAFSPDGKWLATAGHTTDAFVWSEDGTGPLVLPGHDIGPGPNLAGWASNGLLVTGLGFSERVHVWSLPEGKRIRTIDFGKPSYWQVGPELLLAETLESGSDENPGTGVLRSWKLPDGDPEVLGGVDWRKLGTSTSFFAPNGKSWLYVKGRDLYSRPLPVGTGPDRLFSRLGAEVENFETFVDQLVIADKSGGVRVWSYSSNGLAEEKVIRKPDTAPSEALSDPSGRWLSGFPAVDQQVRLWGLTAWSAARPLSLRSSGSWFQAVSRFHPAGDWVVASMEMFTRLAFWPLGKAYPSVVDGYTGNTCPVAFSPDGKWLASGWSDGRLRLWPLPGSGVSDVRFLDLPGPLGPQALAFDPKGRYLFAQGRENQGWIVPLDGSAPRKLPALSEDTLPSAAAVSPSGRKVATAPCYGGRSERILRVWDLETDELRRFDLPETRGDVTDPGAGWEQCVMHLSFADDSTLYTLGDGGLYRWNLETGSHELVAATSPGYGMVGRLEAKRGVAVTGEKRWGQFIDCSQALLHDLKKGTSRRLTEFGDCNTWRWTAVALDESGTMAATGSFDGTVRVGPLSAQEPHLLLGHEGAVMSISISPDLHWVATTGEDHTLRLWPMPDLSKPPLHTLLHEDLLVKLHSLTNVRVVREPSSATGWKVEVGPFPGWKHQPEW